MADRLIDIPSTSNFSRKKHSVGLRQRKDTDGNNRYSCFQQGTGGNAVLMEQR
jgi:hypothetical protein